MTKRIGIAIQLSDMKDEELHQSHEALAQLGIDPIYYGLIYFCDDVTGTERFADYDTVITFGSTKFLRLYQNGLMPKEALAFYSEPSFDQFNYSRCIPNHLLLNGEAKFSTFGKIKHQRFPRAVFVKPTHDLKAFPGVIVEAGMTVGEEVYSRPQDSSLTEDEVVLYSPLKDVVKEYRSFVVDGKIIDSSIYKIGSKVKYEVPTDFEREQLQEFFDILKDHYEPHYVYVVDFAKLEDGSLVVVEYNCFNCAGMYAVDRAKVFKAVIDYANKLANC